MAISDDQCLSMYTPAEIGNAIKKRRRQLKITQKEFAERLDKSERTIQKYESGEITMKIDLIKLVADELDIPWQELLEAKAQTADVPDDDTSVSYQLDTLSDVINALFQITEIGDISFQLSCTKPPEHPDWTSALVVDGKGNGTYNADFCLFMENWMNKLAALQTERITQEQYEEWKKKTLNYYSGAFLTSAKQLDNTDKVPAKNKKKVSSIQIVTAKEDTDE